MDSVDERYFNIHIVLTAKDHLFPLRMEDLLKDCFTKLNYGNLVNTAL